jgi:TolB-like protein
MVDIIKGNTDYSFIHIGSSLFKGANEPTEIYALAGSGLYIPSQSELNLGAKNSNSIAILPFHNTSSEKELDYICDGIAEEIIDSLSKVKDLLVTARSSSFIFKNKEVSIQDISRKLNVSYVLDGSIRKRNDEYRISYQLVDCSTGFNTITDTLSADFKTLYDTEKNISKNILDYFNKDDNGIKPGTEDSFNVNPEAYSYYLQAKYLSSNWQVEFVQQAIKLFEKALEIVPNYALAFAGLSMTHIHMAVNQFADVKESLDKAIVYADKAIAADNNIADGFIAKAIAGFWSGQWYVPDFEINITKALSLSPCNAEIRMFNGMLFLFKGDLIRALSELLLAKQLDPHSVGINLRLGIVQYLTTNYEDAFNTFLSLPDSPKVKTYK